MKYRVFWTKTSIKSLKKINKETAKRIVEKIEEASQDPLKYFKKLHNLPFYSLRIGEYRAIVTLDFTKHTVIVLAIEHRKKIYNHIQKRLKK